MSERFLFLQNGDVSRFSIYVHSTPGFVLDESTTRSQFFYGRQLSNSIQVFFFFSLSLIGCWESDATNLVTKLLSFLEIVRALNCCFYNKVLLPKK